MCSKPRERCLGNMPTNPPVETTSRSLPDFLARTGAWCLIEDVTDGDLHGDGWLNDPGFTQCRGHADGAQFRPELAVPLPAYLAIGGGGRLDAPDLAFELTGNVVGWSSAGDRDLAVVTQVLERLATDCFRQKKRHGFAVGADLNAPCTRAFRHQRRVPCADHDRHTCLQQMNDRVWNHEHWALRKDLGKP